MKRDSRVHSSKEPGSEDSSASSGFVMCVEFFKIGPSGAHYYFCFNLSLILLHCFVLKPR